MVDRWFTTFAYLPGESQRLMAVALWYSGDSRGESALRKQLFNSRHAVEIDALLRERRSPSVASTPVLTESSMNMQWGPSSPLVMPSPCATSWRPWVGRKWAMPPGCHWR